MEENKITLDDLTKRRLDEMSDEEVMLWHQIIQRQAQVNGIRKELANLIEVRDAKRKEHTIHVDSTVVD